MGRESKEWRGFSDPEQDEREQAGAQADRGRVWTWLLGFGCAIVFVWLALAFIGALMGIAAMGDCFDNQACIAKQARLMQHDGSALGLCALVAFVATCLALPAALGRRAAAGALALISAVTSMLLLLAPFPALVGQGSAGIGIAMIPLLDLSLRRWVTRPHA
jgi:hypothetical protein